MACVTDLILVLSSSLQSISDTESVSVWFCRLLLTFLTLSSLNPFTSGLLLYLAALSSPLSPCSHRPDVDPPLFQHSVRGRGHRAPLHPQTLQGVLPQLLHHPGLWSVHHGHPAREANVYKGNIWPAQLLPPWIIDQSYDNGPVRVFNRLKIKSI